MKTVRAALTEVNGVAKKQRSKQGKSLQITKESSIEIKVADKEMALSKEKNLPAAVKKPRAVEQLIAAEKENVSSLRRSKRKTTGTECVTYVESPEESTTSKTKNSRSKAKKPAPKPKRSRSTAKSEQKTDFNQTKLSFTPLLDIPEEKVPDIKEESQTDDAGKCMLGVSCSSDVTKDSGYAPSPGTSHDCTSYSIAVFNSPDVGSYPVTPVNSETNILTAKSPPLSYWMDLAEQRRIALGKALQENEQLHDQLEVLEVENSQIKNLLREAETLTRILMGIID